MIDASNPFAAPSQLPYALPDFAAIREEHYAPAFDAGMAEQLEQLRAITANAEPPTLANTMEALERSGALLARATTVFFNASSADSTESLTAIEEEYAPHFSAHRDAMLLDGALFARIRQLWEARDEHDWSAEELRLVERWHTEMLLAGAALDDTAKARLTELNQRLSTLETRFEKQLLADTNELAVHFDDESALDGLDAGAVSAARQAAADRGLDGYLVTLVLPTGHPFLSSLEQRETREQIMAASRARGIHGGPNDNREIVLELVRLRAARAELLGFANHAAVVTADETAKNPETVWELLNRLAPAAARNARTEQDALARLAGHDILAHDWAFYTERVRAAEYEVDTAALRPWFEAERVLHDGVFFAATALYGIRFTERSDLHGYHPEVRVFEVFEEDGSPLGLFLYDLYTRDSKRGGAWMNDLVGQSELLGHAHAVVVNNHNVPKPAPGEPTLLTFDEVSTLFHEFGHALHGLFGRVRFPKFSGTSVPRDFVEFPSQVNEMWMLWPEVLANYAKHFETGEPLSAETVERLHAAEGFNEGFATSEYLAAAMLDQRWHRLNAAEAAAVTDVAAFEAAAHADAGLDNPAVPTRYASTYFAHTFSGGYDAGYYAYIWSEVLDADTVEWFKEHGGLTRENGQRFRDFVLGVGGARDPLEAYREFRGRDAVIEPLLRRRRLA